MPPADLEDRLADLLLDWEAAASRGAAPTPEEHCRDHPDLVGPFRHLLARLGPVDAVFGGDDLALLAPDQYLAGHDLGRYRPLRFHARGGLGVVFLAEDRELRRPVALKGMQPLAALDPDARRRFLAEAEVTTRLEHPGIVPVYGLVEDGRGRPYYAMRFVRGTTLAEAARAYHADARPSAAREVEFRRLLRNFVALCQTVAYAHSRGVVHRDLKPDNVMLGPYGEVLVIDWGLAKVVGRPTPDEAPGAADPVPPPAAADGAAETQYGSTKGAPAFLSPEQARGEWDRVGPAADVFGLGATLYVLLTGERPYGGRTVAEVMDRAKAGRPPGPGRGTRPSRGRSTPSAGRPWPPPRRTVTRRPSTWPGTWSGGWPTSRCRRGGSRWRCGPGGGPPGTAPW